MRAPIMKYGYSAFLGQWVVYEKTEPRTGDPGIVHDVRWSVADAELCPYVVRGYNDGYRRGEERRDATWPDAVMGAYMIGYETGVADFGRDGVSIGRARGNAA